MKQYVFRQSSTTPDEVMEYLAEKTKTTSFPKLVESLVLGDIAGNEKNTANDVHLVQVAVDEIRVLIDEKSSELLDAVHSDGDQTVDIKGAVLPLVKKLDEAAARRSNDTIKAIERLSEYSNKTTLDEQVMKRNVYMATLAALKRHDEDIKLPEKIEDGFSETQELFLMQLGTTISEQVDALNDIKEDIDSLIGYLSSPNVNHEITVSETIQQESQSEYDDIEENMPDMPMSTLVMHVPEEDEDDILAALDLLYGNDEIDGNDYAEEQLNIASNLKPSEEETVPEIVESETIATIVESDNEENPADDFDDLEDDELAILASLLDL